jgi:DNA-directed RNA polymerase specialized sigma24 family protein
LVRALRPLVGAIAEDIAQEAFLVAQQRWEEVTTLDIPFAWVRRVAIRIAGRTSQRDGMRNEREALISEVAALPHSDAGVLEAIVTLPERQAMAVWLHHIEDQPVVQVADTLDCSVGAAKVLLYRGRQKLAERISGLEGRWVSARIWTPDRIRDHLRDIGAAGHVDPVLEQDLGGRGGRWELTLSDGSYWLHRDDGLRLDYGSFRFNKTSLELTPAMAAGHVVFTINLDGDQLRLNQIDNTTPPTLDVPDWVWMNLFLGAGFFDYSGRRQSTA